MKPLIVRLFTTSKGFPAISYNMDKVNMGDAELLCMGNLELLGAYSSIQTSDLEHYFGAMASLNSKSHYDQFHAVLSAAGNSLTKAEFLKISAQWLREMGYADQPYLVFFHTDTHNRHVHIVSTDVRIDGSKISDSFDRNRAVTHLNRICGIDEVEAFKTDIQRLLDYRCSSIFQLELLFKKSGYHFFIHKQQLLIRKFGKTFLRLNAEKMQLSLASSIPDLTRAREIRSFILSAIQIHNNGVEPVYQKGAGGVWKKIKAFRSDLADFLLMAAGLEVCYLFSQGALTGFTIIDHRKFQLFDGQQIMELSRFIGSTPIEKPLEQRAVYQR